MADPVATAATASVLNPWIGPAIVASAVMLIGQLVLSRLTRSDEKEKDEEKAWTDTVMPVQEACDDLVARFFDMIARQRSLDFAGFDAKQLAGRNVLADPPKTLTTVFRVVKVLVGISYLQKKIAIHGDYSRLRQADLYVSNKVRMALKGNVSGSKLGLATETQQAIGSKFLEAAKVESPHELDFFRFIKALRTDDEACELANLVARALSFDADFSKVQPDQVSFALALIYMIDLHQDLLNSSKWEEFRLYLVSVVRAWNSATGARSVYLYSPKDVSGTDYRDSYARLDFKREMDWRRNWRLRSRQSRGRSISATGIKKEARGRTVVLQVRDAPGDLLQALRSVI
jgi:hypothetical protein